MACEKKKKMKERVSKTDERISIIKKKTVKMITKWNKDVYFESAEVLGIEAPPSKPAFFKCLHSAWRNAFDTVL